MDIWDVIGMLGGLALFLYGMNMMGDGLSLLAGSKLKNILEKLTRNRFLGMLVGAGLTALIQSSNAMTAMTVGFVNAGLMDLSQAIGVIMGANIGTTMTGQLIALKITDVAPVFAFVGVILFLFGKNKKLHYLGQVLAGLGVLFMGMNIMSSSMAPLKDVVWFQNAMTSFKNPLIGIAVGALFTLLVQSSSASIGVMQAMALQGLIGLDSAIYVLCGQNIGCTIAAFMAAVGGNKNAKRTALVHLMFNVAGTIIFVVAAQTLPFVPWVESITPGNGVAQIANAHTIFNVATTAILLPFANQLAKLATRIIPGEDIAGGPQLFYINENAFAAVSIAGAQVDKEVDRMELLARTNIHAALDKLLGRDSLPMETIHENEETIDFLNKEITRALIRMNAMELTQDTARRLSSLYHVLSDIERIGDHAENIAGYAEFCQERQHRFSEDAMEEVRDLGEKVYQIIDEAYKHFLQPVEGNMDEIEELEEHIDDIVDQLNLNHIHRLKENRCTPDIGMIYVEVLTDLERVADHALNIAQAAKYKA
ncbi:MAG: Na/Pi cotransporter family protein [Eubacteriales bacterium]|nr:Na/Pi cotransporter family protein [Eubacteriales bacterium]